MRRVLGAVVFAGLLATIGISAQDLSSLYTTSDQVRSIPRLTDVERLTLQLMVKDLQIAQLQVDRARSQLLTALKALERPGYILNPQDGTYEVAPTPAPTPEAPR